MGIMYRRILLKFPSGLRSSKGVTAARAAATGRGARDDETGWYFHAPALAHPNARRTSRGSVEPRRIEIPPRAPPPDGLAPTQRAASARCARLTPRSARRDLDRDPVQDAVAGERVEARLVGEQVRADAGVLARDAKPGA